MSTPKPLLKPTVSIITPTRGRSDHFARLETFIRNQDYVGEVQWVVVSDRPLDGYEFTMGQEVVERRCGRAWGEHAEVQDDGRVLHSVCLNYLEALNHVRGEYVFCVEDDDLYHRPFISALVGALEKDVLVGSFPNHYVNLASRRWTINHQIPPLAATAFRASLIPTFRSLCLKGDPFMDWGLWRGDDVKGTKVWDWGLYVGIKGHGGVGFGHWPGVGTLDPGGLTIKDVLKEYAPLYGF